MKSNGEFKFPYFLIAMGIGAMGAPLFALSSDEHTRKYLRERSDKGLDYLNRQTGKLCESADGLVKKGKEFMGAVGTETPSRPIPKPRGRPIRKTSDSTWRGNIPC